ncbi:hypothetical protein AYI68_g1822 [Smittium mucronatum]|uniref:Uncharacterized protein n=1 Tax=Smittium mucronatum TaxID=133383 RepID=A0A1R0H4M3_9FUNG|nr:hypothetical protein AYI68_g1822 [Smittium mucronatum]
MLSLTSESWNAQSVIINPGSPPPPPKPTSSSQIMTSTSISTSTTTSTTRSIISILLPTQALLHLQHRPPDQLQPLLPLQLKHQPHPSPRLQLVQQHLQPAQKHHPHLLPHLLLVQQHLLNLQPPRLQLVQQNLQLLYKHNNIYLSRTNYLYYLFNFNNHHKFSLFISHNFYNNYSICLKSNSTSEYYEHSPSPTPSRNKDVHGTGSNCDCRPRSFS